MTAQQLMNADPVVLRDTDTIGTAADKILDHRDRSLPVVDKNGRYLGVVGVSCMLRLVLPKTAVATKGLRGVAALSNTLEALGDMLMFLLELHVLLNKLVLRQKHKVLNRF